MLRVALPTRRCRRCLAIKIEQNTIQMKGLKTNGLLEYRNVSDGRTRLLPHALPKPYAVTYTYTVRGNSSNFPAEFRELQNERIAKWMAAINVEGLRCQSGIPKVNDFNLTLTEAIENNIFI